MNMKPTSLVFKALEFYGTRIPHRGQWWVHDRLRRALRANIDVELEVERIRLKWQLNPSDYTQSEFFWLGANEYWDSFHIKKLLRKGSVIFDNGANFGYYAIALCNALGRNCKVLPLSPIPLSTGDCKKT